MHIDLGWEDVEELIQKAIAKAIAGELVKKYGKARALKYLDLVHKAARDSESPDTG